MHFLIYFELLRNTEFGMALAINEVPTGLRTAQYREKRMFYCELDDYLGSEIKIGVRSLTGEGEIIAHFVSAETGKTFSLRLHLSKDKQSLIVFDTALFNIELEIPENFERGTSKAIVSPIKKSSDHIKSKDSFSKFKVSSDKDIHVNFEYYQKQTRREDILTSRTQEEKNILVDVFYATDRKQKIKKKRRVTYTNARGDLALGKCIVNVPANKAKGALPLPPWYLFNFSKNESKYMLIREVNVLLPEDFFNQLKDKVDSSQEKDAFLFIHGYNVSFTESILRAAQIAVDIGFHGAPIVYSWPSRNAIWHYPSDEATATGYSTDHIIQILKDIRAATNAERIHIIAHSMGNRIITDALKSLVDQGFNKDFLFNQIILAAPDIDAEVFVKNIAPKIVQCSERVTLYASQSDKPLWFSSAIHGKIARAGSITEKLAVIEGVDTIDASIEKTDLLGHGYFAESKALIDDIFQVVRFNKNPEDRNLRQKVSGQKVYWEFW